MPPKPHTLLVRRMLMGFVTGFSDVMWHPHIFMVMLDIVLLGATSTFMLWERVREFPIVMNRLHIADRWLSLLMERMSTGVSVKDSYSPSSSSISSIASLFRIIPSVMFTLLHINLSWVLFFFFTQSRRLMLPQSCS